MAIYRAKETALKGAIVEKSKLFFGCGLFALIAYPFAVFGPSWARWIAVFLIAILLLGEMGMVSALRRLKRFYSPFRADIVLRNHFVLAAISISALAYALLGLWARWPVPWFGLLIGITIYLVHGVGYAARKVDG